jgi:outer membrane protein
MTPEEHLMTVPKPQLIRASSARHLRATWRVGVSTAALLAAAFAYPAHAETLHEAMTLAYQSNPKLDAERARLRATDEGVTQAKAGFRPTAAASATTGITRQTSSPQQQTDGVNHPSGYGITATQSLFSGFRTVNTVREAEANVRAGRENLRLIEQQILLEAVTAYADVIRDQALVRLREKNVSVLSTELQSAEARRSVREVTRTDVAQAQARRAKSVSALDLARSNLKTSRAVYQRVIGRPPQSLTEPQVPNKILPAGVEDVIKIAERENPNIVAALYREQAARHEVDRIWGELLPEARLEAGYNHTYGASSLVNNSGNASITGRVTMPLYEGGEVKARVRAAKHTHVSRLQEIEQARTETQATAVGAWSRLEAIRTQVTQDKIQGDAAKIALEGVREEERVGQRTLLDVLNAEQELLDAEVTAVSNRHDLLIAAHALLASIGQLNAGQLQLGDSQYDPTVHYDEVNRKWFGVSITHADGRVEILDRLDNWGTTDPYTASKGLRASAP